MPKTSPKAPVKKTPAASPESTQKIKENSVQLTASEAEKKKILDGLKSIANKNTRLTVKPFATKPISQLQQLTPFIKVTLKLPKPGSTSFRDVNYDNIDLFFNPSGKTEGSYFNNYIKGFEYSYEGSGGFKCSLSIVDISFDFTDMLLLRMRSFMDTNLTFMDVTFGWTSPEHGMKKQKNGIIFQNTVTFQVQEMIEEDSQFEREIKLTGIVTSTFPDGAGLIMPYSILGPYPLVTYNFIKYLYEPFDVQLKLMGLLPGGVSIAKDAPKFSVNDDEGKIKFVRNLFLSNLLLGKPNPLDKTFYTPKTRNSDPKIAWMTDIFGKNFAKKRNPGEVFPDSRFSGEVSNDLNNIFAQNSIVANNKGVRKLNSKTITDIYYSKKFYSAVKGIGETQDTKSGNPISELVPILAPLLKDARVHPWEAARYFYFTMISVIKSAQETKRQEDSAYDFIEIDFADVINYSANGENNTGTIDEKKIDNKNLNLTSRVLGYNSVNKDAGLVTMQEDPFIKVFGITADSIQVAQGTDWDSLIRMALSKVKVDITNLLSKKEKEEFDKTVPALKKKQKDAKAKDASTILIEENNSIFIEKFKGQPSVAVKFANLSSKMFFGSKTTRDAMFETISNMLAQKIKNGNKSISAIERLGQLDSEIATRGGEVSSARLTEKADKTCLSVIEKYKRLNSLNSLFLTIFLDRSTSIFGEGFGENNIAQAYSVRFRNSANGFSDTEKMSGTSLSLEFPDVVYFKPSIKNLFDHVKNTLPLTDMFEITKKDGGKVISSTIKKSKAASVMDLGAEAGKLEEKYKNPKTSAEEKETTRKELGRVYTELEALTKAQKESEDIRFTDVDPKGVQTEPSANLQKWRERLKFPIKWNTDPKTGNSFLEGSMDGESALLKTSVTNLKRRMIIHSMSYEAELRVIGDPTFVGTYFTDKLVFMKVLMADGRDSIHTGLYQITGFSHALNAGAYFTTFRLMKRPDLNNDTNIIEEMTNSLLKDPIYVNLLSAEDVMDLSAGTNEQYQRKQEDLVQKNKNATKKTKYTADEARANINADLAGASEFKRS